MKGIKKDENKTPIGLLPPEAIFEIGKVFDFGARKYSPHNWRGGFRWSRLYDAVLRHLFAWIGGEDKDPESGLSHLAHAACGLMMLLTHELKGYGEDDRHKE